MSVAFCKECDEYIDDVDVFVGRNHDRSKFMIHDGCGGVVVDVDGSKVQEHINDLVKAITVGLNILGGKQ